MTNKTQITESQINPDEKAIFYIYNVIAREIDSTNSGTGLWPVPLIHANNHNFILHGYPCKGGMGYCLENTARVHMWGLGLPAHHGRENLGPTNFGFQRRRERQDKFSDIQ